MQERILKLAKLLDLAPHPEGGFFKEVFRSKATISKSELGSDFSGDRNVVTNIYFLLTSENFSAFHRIKQDELWHFFEGSGITVHCIDANGLYSKIKLGNSLEEGEVYQSVVPAGCWFASEVSEPDSYALVGCTVAPGFDFDDFELADRKKLIAAFPQHSSIIENLTRSNAS